MHLLYLFGAIVASWALPQGAPPSACDSLLPNHSGVTQQNDAPPFGISTRKFSGGAIVTVRSALGTPFQGIMIQARTPNNQVVGIFEPETDLVKAVDCSAAGDTLTHTSTQKKPSVEVLWRSNGYEGPIIFNATVAQDYSTYWPAVQSQQLLISKRDTNDLPPPPPRKRPVSSTPPYFPQADDITKELSISENDPFYDGCFDKKLCFGAPENCVRNRKCRAAVAVNVYGDRYEFELRATSEARWVGVGLSDDSLMGDDSVLECVRDDNNRIHAFLSYTNPRPNLGVSRTNQPQSSVELLNSTTADGNIYCRVVRDVRTTINGREFDLAKQQFFILVGSGTSVHDDRVSIHDIIKIASGEKRLLSDVSEIGAASSLLRRLHGAFMVAAWIGTASVGMLLARYYKQTWVGSQLFGKDIWFAWHRTFMVLTWALTTAGFVLIFVELRAWSAEQNPHAITGLVTTILCFVQPIGAYFRPHPGTKKRPVFNWLHWLGGNCALILAVATIFLSVKLSKAQLPEWMNWILVGFVVLYVIVQFILSVLSCVSEKASEKRVTSFQMREMGSRSSSAYTERSGDAPYSGVRKVLLALYMIGVISIVVVLILIIVLAPIEDSWDDLMTKIQAANSS